ncbi:MAG: hypothetical protein OXD32_07315 [Endozoicomonadaceae bacterium]|nr:hypothetical protein [Endozoicomonadaceae bacterium]MCY4329180.1 hypothetical protein [Endozoicomonadaceae bacterium]
MKACVKLIVANLLILSTCFACAGDGYLLSLIKQATSADGQQDLKIYLRNNPDAVNKKIESDDGVMITPLIAAILSTRSLDVVKMLVEEHSANISEILMDGKSAISICIAPDDLGDIYQYLLAEEIRIANHSQLAD